MKKKKEGGWHVSRTDVVYNIRRKQTIDLLFVSPGLFAPGWGEYICSKTWAINAAGFNR